MLTLVPDPGEVAVLSAASAPSSPMDVARRAFDALNRHDLALLRALLADDVVEHIVPVGVHDGHREVLAYFQALLAAAPDLQVDLTRVAGVEDVVLAEWEVTATFSGAPFLGLEPNGRRVRLEGASSHVVREGRVASSQVLYDSAACARQIGLLPPRGSAADRAMVIAYNFRTQVERRRTRPRGEGGGALGRSPERPDAPEGEGEAGLAMDELAELLHERELAVIATDLAGTVSHWNHAAERLYGWSRAEALGRPITELTVGPDDSQVAENIMAAVRESGRWEGEFWVRRRDGTRFLAHVREALLTDEHGRRIGLVGVSVDVPATAPGPGG
jgi:steroid delta-isomerase-like uncharacterized protein